MAEKKRMYEAGVLALPPLHLVLGDMTVPDPDWQRKAGQKRQKLAPEMEGTVKRLIAHFKDEK
jgi:hypothetical protein